MIKHVEVSDPVFTRGGMLLGLVAYIAVGLLIAWVFC